MEQQTPIHGIFLSLVTLLSRILDLDEGIKLDHGRRVALLAYALAAKMHIRHPEQLYLAGLLHDIGGAGLSNHILHHAKLGFQDMEAREHASRGAVILRSFQPFCLLADWVQNHHERHDGTGFPAARSRQEIPLEAGILHLSDLLDIFAHHHSNLSQAAILSFIDQQAGKSVSPAIAEAGKRLFSDTPSVRELLTGPLLETMPVRDFCNGLPGIADFSAAELISQLLWLTARIADTRHPGKQQSHSIHVACYCHLLAKGLNLPGVDPLELLWAALLHNTGLAAVPWAELLLDYDIRPEISLTYRRHPLLSAELIRTNPTLAHLAPVIAAHHEHHDGSGFPLGLKGDQIPVAAQVIALADTYQWITKDSVKNSHEQALTFLEKGKGTLFDPTLTDQVVALLNRCGTLDASWLIELPNIHAFFTSPGQDFLSVRQPLLSSHPRREEKHSVLFPRQWQQATLSSDLHFQSGAPAFAQFAGLPSCKDLRDTLSPQSRADLSAQLDQLEGDVPLTMTLHSRTGVAIELIFIRMEKDCKLLWRGINTAPIFEQTASIFYQNFLQHPEPQVLLDHQGQIKELNTAFLTSFPFPGENLKQTTIIELFRPYLSPGQTSDLRNFFREQQDTIWSSELSFSWTQNHPRHISATLYRIGGHKQDHPTFLCRLTDISDRKQVEEELLQRDRELQGLIHNTTGATGTQFFKILLYQFILLTGARIGIVAELMDNNRLLVPHIFWEEHRFWPPPDSFSVRKTPSRIVTEQGETYFPRRLTELFPSDQFLRDRNINSYWGLPLRRQDGVIIGILALYHDKTILHSKNIQAIAKIFQARFASELVRMQTERILLEKDRQLEAQNQELTRMNQLKSDMIAITSHDLKAPLSAIIGYASLLEEHADGFDRDKIAHYIRRIHDEGKKQLTFINKLLDLYRIESGAIELTLAPHRLDLLLDSCLSSLQELARAKKIRFSYTENGKARPLALDPLRMGQVFTNLISNAIKFSPEEGKIQVHCEHQPDRIRVHISDQGPGIDEKEIHRIFDRYYTGRTDFTIRPQGSGLGLFIVRNIVELHGGSVSAANRPEGGSCFTVFLPETTPGNPA